MGYIVAILIVLVIWNVLLTINTFQIRKVAKANEEVISHDLICTLLMVGYLSKKNNVTKKEIDDYLMSACDESGSCGEDSVIRCLCFTSLR